MKTRLIVNCRSGRSAQAFPLVRAFADSRQAELVETTHSRHATELAREAIASGCELIVAVGGDGTMNEVATAVVGSTATLGLIPCGSGDGLGRHLGIHGSVQRALSILEHGTTTTIDSATADGHPFFTTAGVGFEAEIAQRFNALERRGFFRYLTTAAPVWRSWQCRTYQVEDAAGQVRLQALTVAVGNANQYGNGARIAPKAQINDGALDLTAIPPSNLLTLPLFACRLFAGSIHLAPGVLSRRAAAFTISSDAPMRLHTDGEIHEAGRTIEFRVRPASLRIRVPR